jgi:hypothetical protein
MLSLFPLWVGLTGPPAAFLTWLSPMAFKVHAWVWNTLSKHLYPLLVDSWNADGIKSLLPTLTSLVVLQGIWCENKLFKKVQYP